MIGWAKSYGNWSVGKTASPKYIRTSAEQILNDFRHYVGQMHPKLPELFTALPKSPLTVEAIPGFQAATATHYVAGTPDGKRPGRIVVATSNSLTAHW